MKRLMKLLLFFAGVIFVIGLGLSLGGIAMGASTEEVSGMIDFEQSCREVWNLIRNADGWEIFHHSDEEWDEEWEEEDHGVSDYEETASGRICHAALPEEIRIELSSDDLILKEYDGTDVQIQVENDGKENVRVKSEDGGRKLRIRSINYQKGRRITLSWPAGARFQLLDLQAGAGTVCVKDDLLLEELKAEVGAGEFTAEGRITADEAKLELGAGTIDFAFLDAGQVDGECGMGSMELTLAGAREDYEYRLECGMGEISLGDSQYGGLGQTREFKNSGADRKVKLECGMGEIAVLFEERGEDVP